VRDGCIVSRHDWRVKTRELFNRFVQELPLLLGIWLLVALFLAVFAALTGSPVWDAVLVAVAFLPLAIPMAPILWLRWEPRAADPRAFPAIGLGCLWAIVTLPFAAGTQRLAHVSPGWGLVPFPV
jgi:hypothetical protein